MMWPKKANWNFLLALKFEPVHNQSKDLLQKGSQFLKLAQLGDDEHEEMCAMKTVLM